MRKAVLSSYNFSLPDYLLYVRYGECPGRVHSFPEVKVVAAGGDYAKLAIGGYEYFWPADESTAALGWVYQEVFCSAPQNLHAYEFGCAKIYPGDRVIDAGCGEGFFARYALESGATVAAIEPVSKLARALEKTFAGEIEAQRMRVFHYALGSTTGTGGVVTSQASILESSVDRKGSGVDIVALDDLMEGGEVDFIKMDIEGAEVDAIMGCRKTIVEQKPKLSLAVYHEAANAKSITSLLRDMRPDYTVIHRGIFAYGGCEPRPSMLYAW